MDKTINSHDRILNFNGKLYRLQRVIDKTEIDIHHLIWRKYRQKYNTNAEINKVKINRRKHVALNAFFLDKQSPREQLIEVFNLVKPVLSRWVKQELEIILNCDDDLFYKEEVLKKWKKKKNDTNTKI